MASIRILSGKKWKIADKNFIDDQDARIIVQHLAKMETCRFCLDCFSGFLGIEHIYGTVEGQWITLNSAVYFRIDNNEDKKIKEICKKENAKIYKKLQ